MIGTCSPLAQRYTFASKKTRWIVNPENSLSAKTSVMVKTALYVTIDNKTQLERQVCLFPVRYVVYCDIFQIFALRVKESYSVYVKNVDVKLDPHRIFGKIFWYCHLGGIVPALFWSGQFALKRCNWWSINGLRLQDISFCDRAPFDLARLDVLDKGLVTWP